MRARNRADKEKEAKSLIRAIIRVLRNPPDNFPTFVFKKRLNGISGFYDFDTITLAIYAEPIQTLFHEIIHFLHSDWTESKVINCEKMVKHYITMKEVIKILKLFVKHL